MEVEISLERPFPLYHKKRQFEYGQIQSHMPKIMIVRENQVTPLHFHWKKAEDIINRGGESYCKTIQFNS